MDAKLDGSDKSAGGKSGVFARRQLSLGIYLRRFNREQVQYETQVAGNRNRIGSVQCRARDVSAGAKSDPESTANADSNDRSRRGSPQGGRRVGCPQASAPAALPTQGSSPRSMSLPLSVSTLAICRERE